MATPEEKKILQVYGALAAALVMMLIPHMAACVVALLLLTGTLVMAYGVKRKAEAHSLAADHMSFILRTIGIGSLMAVLTTTVASVYLLQMADLSPLQPCADRLSSQLLNSPAPETMPDVAQMSAVVMPCVHPFVMQNRDVFMAALLIAAALPLVYFAYRMAKGLSRARRGHRIGDAHKWL